MSTGLPEPATQQCDACTVQWPGFDSLGGDRRFLTHYVTSTGLAAFA